ncbi:unnamed protein product, partial [Amoebophrya sp. A25]
VPAFAAGLDGKSNGKTPRSLVSTPVGLLPSSCSGSALGGRAGNEEKERLLPAPDCEERLQRGLRATDSGGSDRQRIQYQLELQPR